MKPGPSGFTLVEILVVAILGLLTALVASNVFRQWDSAREQAARADTAQILSAVKSYYLRERTPPSMQDLVDPPPELEGFTGVPLDPWDREYQLLTEGRVDEWHVISAGPDGEFDTDDDITSRDSRRQA